MPTPCSRRTASGRKFPENHGERRLASPTDPISYLGFSKEEVVAVVEEANKAPTYVAARLYTDPAIARAVHCGVRSVEHTNLIEAPTAKLMREKRRYRLSHACAYQRSRTKANR